MTRWLSALLVLALPATAWAGHVESDILREGSPAAWWRNHRTEVLADLARTAGPGAPCYGSLEGRLGAGADDARETYLTLVLQELRRATPKEKHDLWAGADTWAADAHAAERLATALRRDPTVMNANLTGEEWLQASLEALSRNSGRRRRLAAFLAQPRVADALLKGLGPLPVPPPERMGSGGKAIVDCVLVLAFLRPDNRSFFLNGYSTTEISPDAGYAGLYPKLAWDAASIEGLRRETVGVLEEMGPATVAYLARTLDELDQAARSRVGNGATMPLPATSLAAASRWSTKAVSFPVTVHASFRPEAERIIAKFGGRRATTGAAATAAVATPDFHVVAERAHQVFARHEAELRRDSDLHEAWVDEHESGSLILLVAHSAEGAARLMERLGADLEGVPVRIQGP